MTYFVTIDMSNAAFDEYPGIELARILRGIANRVEGYAFNNPDTKFPVRDANGNRVGTHGYMEDEQ